MSVLVSIFERTAPFLSAVVVFVSLFTPLILGALRI
jgi:hypothetical protein